MKFKTDPKEIISYIKGRTVLVGVLYAREVLERRIAGVAECPQDAYYSLGKVLVVLDEPVFEGEKEGAMLAWFEPECREMTDEELWQEGFIYVGPDRSKDHFQAAYKFKTASGEVLEREVSVKLLGDDERIHPKSVWGKRARSGRLPLSP